MADEKIRNSKICKYNKYRRILFTKLYAKLCEINEWWRKRHPHCYNLIYCNLLDISIEPIDTAYIFTITLCNTIGLPEFKYKLHGNRLSDMVKNFGKDYKKLLEIMDKYHLEMMWNHMGRFINSLGGK